MTSKKNTLKHRFMGAMGWTLFGFVFGTVLRLGSSLILTRLLAPDLYGVMAVGYMVITALTMVSDIGLVAGAMQSRNGERPIYLNVTWVVAIARGGILMALALLLALGLHLGLAQTLLPAQSVYADPRIPGLIAVVSLWCLVTGLESTKTLLARRSLSLERLTKIDLACHAASTVFIVAWAALSPTVWALAFGWVFGAALKTLLSHVALPGPANKLEWDRTIFREVFHFGKWTFVSSAFAFAITTGDRILLGTFLDARTMGLFSIALVLMGTVQTIVLRLSAQAVLPALSEVARDRPAELKRAYYRVRLRLDAICLVAAGMVFFLGPPIVELLYDDRYLESGWMLSIIALTLVATRLDVFDQCLIALGRPKLLTLLNAVRLAALYIIVPTGYLTHGVPGAIWGLAASAVASMLAVMLLQARLRLLDVSRELLLVPFLGGGLLLGWAVRWMLP